MQKILKVWILAINFREKTQKPGLQLDVPSDLINDTSLSNSVIEKYEISSFPLLLPPVICTFVLKWKRKVLAK